MKAMVFCAGLSTRLRPLSELWPKPACTVLNRPLIAFNFALLKGIGVGEVAVNTHHLADRMASTAKTEAQALGLGLELSHESTLLGHGGGLKALEAWLGGGTFALLNGDFIFDLDLARVIEAHRRSGAAATLVVQSPLPGYRPLHALSDGRLACLPGETPPSGTTPWHFTGVHIVEPAIFSGLVSGPSGIFETGYRSLLEAGAPVRVHVDSGIWRDIQTAESYLSTNLEALKGRLPLARFDALGPLAAIHPRARVDGSVEESVIGAGAVIPAGASVRRSVVLADTELGENEGLENAIAAGGLRIRI
jgi:mannose-1-phosphate guanylyltransferase